MYKVFQQQCCVKVIQQATFQNHNYGITCCNSVKLSCFCLLEISFVFLHDLMNYPCVLGQAYVIFKAKDRAEQAVKAINGGCLMLSQERYQNFLFFLCKG